MLGTLLIVFAVLYALFFLLLSIALSRSYSAGDVSFRPRVSVIVAARNEEPTIERCLKSLAALRYPRDLLEILIVDDNSSDGTAAIAGEHARAHPSVRVLSCGPHNGQLRGKAFALARGIDEATGEFLLFTDADCLVPEDWVENTVKYYVQKEVGMVAGFTLLRYGRPFDSMQALDWFFLFSVASALVRLGHPVTAVGNNLSIRRTTYDAVGGLRGVPFSVTEDYALVNAVTTRTRFRVLFPLDQATLVESLPCRNWSSLFMQKLRWFRGGKDMATTRLLIFAVAFALHALLVVGAFVSPQAIVTPAIVKTLSDVIMTIPALRIFRQVRLVAVFPLFELYYTAYVLLFPILVTLGVPVRWKERTHP